MSKKFKGKKLLMLGSNVGSKEMVAYAKDNGAYTIVADYYDELHSQAKQIANESILISTADIDKLSSFIKERSIDGVLAGVSEFNLLKAMELSELHSLPFYFNKIQWDKISHKDQFRKICIKNDVPSPKTYYIGNKISEIIHADIKFPMILKPVDSCTSRGVHICKNISEVKSFFNDALEKSSVGRVIMEEYVDGDEFTAHYTICNGKAALTCMDNRYPVAVHEGNVTTIPAARIYPSTYIEKYLNGVNNSMIRLCESLGIKNGVLFIQGIHSTKTGGFWIFEAGLRSAAETPNRFIQKINGIDYLNILVDHVLLEETEYNQTKEDPFMKNKCCGIYSFVAKHGVVNSITGLRKAVFETPSVIDTETRYPIGSVTPDSDTLQQIMIRFVMICENREQMIKDISYLNKSINVFNDEGKDMIIKIDPQRLKNDFTDV